MDRTGISGRSVRIRRNKRARRLILRLDRRDGTPTLTVPPGTPQLQIDMFLMRHEDWIAKQSAAMPDSVMFTPGSVIPYRGVDHIICHCSDLPRTPLVSAGHIAVGGPLESLAGRVERFLRSEARAALVETVGLHAHRLGVTPTAITIRDTYSRWGSCSTKGGLNFSWRLIMAPADILSYVAAHEVAHLIEMNHSPRFWALVDGLVDNRIAAGRWLRRHGARLMRIGTPVIGA